MKSWQYTLIGLIAGLIISAAVYLIALPPQGMPVELLPAPSPAPILVHVSGKVQVPGVYELPPGSRVEKAIFAAGGFSIDANQQSLNLAARLEDGDKVHVPAIGDFSQEDSSSPGVSDPPEKKGADTGILINLNTATLEELLTLPGIGETRAKDILSYRESHGEFQSIEEIQEVPGIGPGLFESMKELLTIE